MRHQESLIWAAAEHFRTTSARTIHFASSESLYAFFEKCDNSETGTEVKFRARRFWRPRLAEDYARDGCWHLRLSLVLAVTYRSLDICRLSTKPYVARRSTGWLTSFSHTELKIGPTFVQSAVLAREEGHMDRYAQAKSAAVKPRTVFAASRAKSQIARSERNLAKSSLS